MDEVDQPQGNAAVMHRRIVVGVIVIVILAALGGGTRWWSESTLSSVATNERFVYSDQPQDYQQVDWVAYEKEQAKIAAGGEHYQPLQAVVEIPGIEISGVEDPELTSAVETTANKALEVIGFNVNGQAYAFCIDAMIQIPRHVVNIKQDDRSIAVSYCDISDCARVVTSDRMVSQPLGIGGLDIHGGLVLLLGGERYGHLSAALPMDDVAFERMSLGNWLTKHPHSMIYCDCGAPTT